jgi:hypothetical protein
LHSKSLSRIRLSLITVLEHVSFMHRFIQGARRMKRSPTIQLRSGVKKISAGIIDGYRVFDLELHLRCPATTSTLLPDQLSHHGHIGSI